MVGYGRGRLVCLVCLTTNVVLLLPLVPYEITAEVKVWEVGVCIVCRNHIDIKDRGEETEYLVNLRTGC